MGLLTQSGQALGQWMAGSGTAPDLAARSLQWGALATGLDVGANLASAVETYGQAKYAAKVASEGAAETRLAGQYAEGMLKSHYTRLEAAQKVAQAANGIDVDSPSAVAVRESTAKMGALDAAMMHFNAAREAYADETQAALYKRAGTSALIKGVAGAGLSIIGGAQSLGQKWLAYQRSGAYNG